MQTRSYDAENHLIGEALQEQPGSSITCNDGTLFGSTSYAWGLEGHPWSYGATGAPSTAVTSLHWDGGALLYVYAPGALTLYIGTLGAVQLAGTTVTAGGIGTIETLDRDSSGIVQQRRTATNFSSFKPFALAIVGTIHIPVAARGGTGKGIAPHTALSFPVFPGADGCAFVANAPTNPIAPLGAPPVGMDRTDGYQLAADVTIQGVRAYDPSTAQWTSPDAYAGTTTDPGSQKPFMWNGNNPVAYGDPSGFSPDCTDPAPGQPPNGCMGGVNWTAQYSFLKSVWSDVLWLLPGGPDAKAGEEFFQHFGTQVADTFRGELSHLISGGHLVQSGQTTVIEVHGGEAALRGAFQSLAKASGKSTEFSANGVEFFETDGWSASLRPFSSNKSGNLPTLQISRVTRSGGSVLKIRALRIPR